MNTAAAASLGRRRLTSHFSNGLKLCLDHLLVRPFPDLDHTFVVSLTRLRNAKDMLSRRYVSKNDAT